MGLFGRVVDISIFALVILGISKTMLNTSGGEPGDFMGMECQGDIGFDVEEDLYDTENDSVPTSPLQEGKGRDRDVRSQRRVRKEAKYKMSQ